VPSNDPPCCSISEILTKSVAIMATRAECLGAGWVGNRPFQSMAASLLATMTEDQAYCN